MASKDEFHYQFEGCGEGVLLGAYRNRSRLKSSVCWSRGGMKAKSKGWEDECSEPAHLKIN